MPSIRNSEQATMLQLQYIAESCGLNRIYLDTETDSLAGKNVAASAQVTVQSPDEVEPQQRPDINWHPSYGTYNERVKRLAADGTERPTALPEGFPQFIDAPRVWSGSDFTDPKSFVIELTLPDIIEIEAGLAYFKSLPGDHGPAEVTAATFPLPNLNEKLAAVAHTVHYGIGFSIIRGLTPTKYSPLDNVLLYLGITSYIADIRGCQDYDGKMLFLCHIKDREKDLPEETGRPSPYTSRAQPFHNDRCDILAMYALTVAAEGGESLLASSGKIYNEIAAIRPDVIHVLSDDKWIFDEFVTPASWHSRPLLYNFDKHGPGFCYSRRPLTGAPFSPHICGVPAMTEAQAEAIDMVHFTAAKHQLQIKLQPGDIEIFNNLGMMHARNGFVDDEFHKRHAIRLWLKNEAMAWKRPDALLAQAGELYDAEGPKSLARWDIEKSPAVYRPILRHMACS